MESKRPLWKGLGNTLHGYTGKGLGDLRSACYLFASCNFCRVGVVGLTARSDTFHAAVRVVERNGGIYWLYYGDLGREDSNLFSVSLFPFTSRISISFVAKKKSVCKYPFEIAACRSARRHLLRAFPFGHVAMCPFPPQDA